MTIATNDSHSHNSHTNNALQAPVSRPKDNDEALVKTEKLTTTNNKNQRHKQTSNVSPAARNLTKKDESLIKQINTRA
ncbi:hypothetical protein EVAR_72770_1, partial [Eumeta japonica]